MIAMSEFYHNDMNDEKISDAQPKERSINQNIMPEPGNNDNKKEPSKALSTLQAWLSGAIGGLTVLIIGFLLLYNGVISLDPFIENEQLISNPPTQSGIIQTSGHGDGVSAELLSDVAGAVVGVANYRSLNLFSENVDAGTGSGVIYKVEGDRAYVVTNQHVINGANQIEVILTNGEHVDATLHGQDELTDLAVLSIDAEHADVIATFGSSSELIVGEPAIAIGNPLGTEFAGTVTKGIISGLDRTLEMDLNKDGVSDWSMDVIQTDAAINPGNSGGALINSSGEVIGINSMKIATHAVEGIGFAIPIDEAIPIIEQLESDGTVTRPFIGISAIDLSSVSPRHVQGTLQLDPAEVTGGIVIAEVHPDSSADQAGLKTYDVIVEIGDKEINDMLDLRQFLYQDTEIGERVMVSYYRDGILEEVEIVLQGE